MTLSPTAASALQDLEKLGESYAQVLALPELALDDLQPLRDLDEGMHKVVEQALAIATDEPGAAAGLQAGIARIAELNQQLLQKVEQGRAGVAQQLGEIGKARRGVRAYQDSANLPAS